MNYFKIRNIVRLTRRILKAIIGKDLLLFSNCDVVYELLGTDYGGWPAINSVFNERSIIYSFGIGDDISWDLEIIKRYNVKVQAFDPTSRCQQWLLKQKVPPEFVYHNIGLSDHDGIEEFVVPDKEHSVSYSSVKNGAERKKEKFRVLSLDRIMRKLGHNHIDILKMDIEGGEYKIIIDIVKKNIFPDVLMVEFHHRFQEVGIDLTIDAIRMLKSNNYCIFYISANGEEVGFLRKESINENNVP